MTNTPSVLAFASAASVKEMAGDAEGGDTGSAPAANVGGEDTTLAFLLPDPFLDDLVRGEHGCFADDDAVEDDGHLKLHAIEACGLDCPWKGTVCCLQVVLTEQAIAEHRLSLGVLCGLKQFYHPHALPPCVVGRAIDWSEPASRAGEEVRAA